jgi:hypothetical protein
MSPNDPAVEIHSWPPASKGSGWLVSSSPSLLWTSTVVVGEMKWLERALNNDVDCSGFPVGTGGAAEDVDVGEFVVATTEGAIGILEAVFSAFASNFCSGPPAS